MKEYQPLHSQVNRIKNLRQGQTVYTVSALGKQSFLQKIVIMDKPFLKSSWYCGITCKVFFDPIYLNNNFYTTESSLQDMNVIPNTYNDHRLFTSRRKAESYLKLCKKLDTDSSSEMCEDFGWDDCCDYFDEDRDKEKRNA